MKIENIMTPKVICVDMDDRLYVVRELFIRHKFHHLMVTNNQGALVAVISDRDYFKATNNNINLPSANEKDLATLNKRVHQVTSKKLVSIEQSASFSDAIKQFHTHNVSCLPVINAKNHPVGVVTWRDVINLLYNKVAAAQT